MKTKKFIIALMLPLFALTGCAKLEGWFEEKFGGKEDEVTETEEGEETEETEEEEQEEEE